MQLTFKEVLRAADAAPPHLRSFLRTRLEQLAARPHVDKKLPWWWFICEENRVVMGYPYNGKCTFDFVSYPEGMCDMEFVSYETLLKGIAEYPSGRRARAFRAVEAVIAHGGAERGKNNWRAYWDRHGDFVLYYQASVLPDGVCEALARECKCKCDFVHCIPRVGWDDLYLATFSDWELETLESWGLF